MPNYTFENKKTKKTVTEFMSLAERDEWLSKNKDWHQVPVSATPTLDSVRIGITKPPADFSKYVLGRMKENVAHNNIGERRFDVAREV